MKLCIVQPNLESVTETFLQAQAAGLPAETTLLYGMRPRQKGVPLSAADRSFRLGVRLLRWLSRRPPQWEMTCLFRRALQRIKPQVVLAHYGPTGVRVMDACLQLRIPLVVHFHGGDANNFELVRRHRDHYRLLFRHAAGTVAVSRVMRQKLLALGAPAEKTHYIPSGACCRRFEGSDPLRAEPLFLTVGRLAESKGPHFTLIAFAELLRQYPAARLRMVGDGPLVDFCRQLAFQLGVTHAVTFLGAQSHDRVAREMRAARALVHHSVVASTGDAEGTPVVVMEAGASGLPVIGSRVGGIPEVILHERTGLLVDARDIADLVRQMKRLVDDPAFAARLGQAASTRVREQFSQKVCLEKLWSLLQACAHPALATNRLLPAAA